MRYTRDNSLNTAYSIVSDRIRALPEYRNARELALESAVRRVFDYDRDGPTVAVLRRMGGFTRIAEYALEMLPEHYRADKGSKMFPRSVVDELRADLPALREDLQTRVAREVSRRRG